MNQNEYVIVYASDSNYVPHMAVSMLSIMKTNKDEKFHFIVLDNDIEKVEKEKLQHLCEKYGQKLEFENIQEKIKNANLKTSFNHTAFARLFIGEILTVDKALYLDCDTIVCGSLKPLFNMNLYENLIAGVQDTVSSKLRMVVGLQYEERYVNSGVLLMNLNLWRKCGLQKRFMKCIEKFEGNVPHNDQGVINAVCRGKTQIMDAKYNMHDSMLFYTVDQLKELFDMPIYYDSVRFKEDKKHPIIVHYTEWHYGRPWFKDSNHPYKDVYLKYRKELLEYWPMPKGKTKVTKRINRGIKHAMYSILPFSCYKHIFWLCRNRKERNYLKNIRKIRSIL